VLALAAEADVSDEAAVIEAAAELLTLRRDTLRIIDGAGPSVEVHQSESTAQGRVSGTESERVSSPVEQPENFTETITELTEMVDQTPSGRNEHAANRDAVGDQKQAAKPPKCTFSGWFPSNPSVFWTVVRSLL
jgi:hypothetical protein